jgi:hypothetical protein
MSERSSRRDALAGCVVALALTACGKQTKKPEADPDQAKKLAAAIADHVPLPTAVPTCKAEETIGGATMTFRTALQIAGASIPNELELAEWVNAPTLDHPSARALADTGTDETHRRQAAAELLGAPFYFVYKVDTMSAPIPAGRHEASRGYVGMRGIKYDQHGAPVCVVIYVVKNTRSKAEWAMDEVEKHAVLDPKVIEAMREDLQQQQMRAIQSQGLPIPPPS